MPTTKPDAEPRGENQVLDKALADTFPASDPPAATSITPAAPIGQRREMSDAYLVLSQATAEKNIEDWRTCGQARWLSANTPALQLALSPALALLDAFTTHGFDVGQEWALAHLVFPTADMLRLDTPHECWRERTFRNDVRLSGDRWALEQQSAFLRVPSAVCPNEFNLLVNLVHRDRENLRVHEVHPVDIDPRLQQR